MISVVLLVCSSVRGAYGVHGVLQCLMVSVVDLFVCSVWSVCGANGVLGVLIPNLTLT